MIFTCEFKSILVRIKNTEREGCQFQLKEAKEPVSCSELNTNAYWICCDNYLLILITEILKILQRNTLVAKQYENMLPENLRTDPNWSYLMFSFFKKLHKLSLNFTLNMCCLIIKVVL